MFDKILIANRGAIARRIVRACNDLGVASAVVYSEADAGAPYLAEAGEAVALPGSRAQDTYLNVPVLLQALRHTGADAVHPGYGFLAENADFAEAVEAAGAVFIGPRPRWLRDLGDKLRARELLARHDMPMFAASGALRDADHAVEAAAGVGYPLMLKPRAGGGGIGMRVVRSEAELRRFYLQARALAQRAFGSGELFLEEWIAQPRHVEFQLLADKQGNAMHLYERECSIQRRHQKVLEEAPAPGIGRTEIEPLAERAAQVAGALGYDNVGTAEMLRAPDGRYGFLELNTRIQVEHGVTEAVTGIDLVAAQIGLAAGQGLPERPALDGFAVEARVYAEDPQTQLPDAGVLRTYRTPRMHEVRVDTGYAEGLAVSPYYDALLAKLIARGSTREQAIGRALVGLKAFTVRGLKTNIPLLLRILESEEFLAGRVHTGFIQRLGAAPRGAG